MLLVPANLISIWDPTRTYRIQTCRLSPPRGVQMHGTFRNFWPGQPLGAAIGNRAKRSQVAAVRPFPLPRGVPHLFAPHLVTDPWVISQSAMIARKLPWTCACGFGREATCSRLRGACPGGTCLGLWKLCGCFYEKLPSCVPARWPPFPFSAAMSLRAPRRLGLSPLPLSAVLIGAVRFLHVVLFCTSLRPLTSNVSSCTSWPPMPPLR